jgi:hypothetical protein
MALTADFPCPSTGSVIVTTIKSHSLSKLEHNVVDLFQRTSMLILTSRANPPGKRTSAVNPFASISASVQSSGHAASNSSAWQRSGFDAGADQNRIKRNARGTSPSFWDRREQR